jgi:antitoxin component of MazEF toxin-antitoxin module
MSDKQTGREDVRKIQRTGQKGASYMLTIPKHIIQALGWDERQKVVVKQEGNKIIIVDWKDK